MPAPDATDTSAHHWHSRGQRWSLILDSAEEVQSSTAPAASSVPLSPASSSLHWQHKGQRWALDQDPTPIVEVSPQASIDAALRPHLGAYESPVKSKAEELDELLCLQRERAERSGAPTLDLKDRPPVRIIKPASSEYVKSSASTSSLGESGGTPTRWLMAAGRWVSVPCISGSHASLSSVESNALVQLVGADTMADIAGTPLLSSTYSDIETAEAASDTRSVVHRTSAAASPPLIESSATRPVSLVVPEPPPQRSGAQAKLSPRRSHSPAAAPVPVRETIIATAMQSAGELSGGQPSASLDAEARSTSSPIKMLPKRSPLAANPTDHDSSTTRTLPPPLLAPDPPPRRRGKEPQSASIAAALDGLSEYPPSLQLVVPAAPIPAPPRTSLTPDSSKQHEPERKLSRSDGSWPGPPPVPPPRKKCASGVDMTISSSPTFHVPSDQLDTPEPAIATAGSTRHEEPNFFQNLFGGYTGEPEGQQSRPATEDPLQVIIRQTSETFAKIFPPAETQTEAELSTPLHDNVNRPQSWPFVQTFEEGISDATLARLAPEDGSTPRTAVAGDQVVDQHEWRTIAAVAISHDVAKFYSETSDTEPLPGAPTTASPLATITARTVAGSHAGATATEEDPLAFAATALSDAAKNTEVALQDIARRTSETFEEFAKLFQPAPTVVDTAIDQVNALSVTTATRAATETEIAAALTPAVIKEGVAAGLTTSIALAALHGSAMVATSAAVDSGVHPPRRGFSGSANFALTLPGLTASSVADDTDSQPASESAAELTYVLKTTPIKQQQSWLDGMLEAGIREGLDSPVIYSDKGNVDLGTVGFKAATTLQAWARGRRAWLQFGDAAAAAMVVASANMQVSAALERVRKQEPESSSKLLRTLSWRASAALRLRRLNPNPPKPGAAIHVASVPRDPAADRPFTHGPAANESFVDDNGNLILPKYRKLAEAQHWRVCPQCGRIVEHHYEDGSSECQECMHHFRWMKANLYTPVTSLKELYQEAKWEFEEKVRDRESNDKSVRCRDVWRRYWGRSSRPPRTKEAGATFHAYRTVIAAPFHLVLPVVAIKEKIRSSRIKRDCETLRNLQAGDLSRSNSKFSNDGESVSSLPTFSFCCAHTPVELIEPDPIADVDSRVSDHGHKMRVLRDPTTLHSPASRGRAVVVF